MKLRNASRWVIHPRKAYAFALGAFLCAFALRMLLHQFLQNQFPILFFLLANTVVAYRYGIWPSLFCTALSMPTALYFFIQPYGSWGPIEIADWYLLIFNGVATLMCSGFLELLNRERYNSDLLTRVSDSRYRMMVELDEDRRYHQSEQERMSISGAFQAKHLVPAIPPTSAPIEKPTL